MMGWREWAVNSLVLVIRWTESRGRNGGNGDGRNALSAVSGAGSGGISGIVNFGMAIQFRTTTGNGQ